jgi:hypothetical protein
MFIFLKRAETSKPSDFSSFTLATTLIFLFSPAVAVPLCPPTDFWNYVSLLVPPYPVINDG